MSKVSRCIERKAAIIECISLNNFMLGAHNLNNLGVDN
jgi:hypothetical protein